MHLGASSHGFIHSSYELYVAEFSSRLLSSLARLVTNFLQLHGSTMGVEDILLNASADKKRKKILSKTPPWDWIPKTDRLREWIQLKWRDVWAKPTLVDLRYSE